MQCGLQQRGLENTRCGAGQQGSAAVDEVPVLASAPQGAEELTSQSESGTDTYSESTGGTESSIGQETPHPKFQGAALRLLR